MCPESSCNTPAQSRGPSKGLNSEGCWAEAGGQKGELQRVFGGCYLAEGLLADSWNSLVEWKEKLLFCSWLGPPLHHLVTVPLRTPCGPCTPKLCGVWVGSPVGCPAGGAPVGVLAAERAWIWLWPGILAKPWWAGRPGYARRVLETRGWSPEALDSRSFEKGVQGAAPGADISARPHMPSSGKTLLR